MRWDKVELPEKRLSHFEQNRISSIFIEAFLNYEEANEALVEYGEGYYLCAGPIFFEIRKFKD